MKTIPQKHFKQKEDCIKIESRIKPPFSLPKIIFLGYVLCGQESKYRHLKTLLIYYQ